MSPEERRKKREKKLLRLEGLLRKFWSKFGKKLMVNARHTEVVIEPKVMLGKNLNPEVSKRLVQVFLAKLKPEKLVKNEVVINPDQIIIKDPKGRLVAEVTNPKLINSITNRLINSIGKKLSQKESLKGGAYVENKEFYTFGDLKPALLTFMADMERHDCKNLLRDASLILFHGEAPVKLHRPEGASDGEEIVVDSLVKKSEDPSASKLSF